MRSNRSSNTKPEVNLRKALWAAGVRGYRKNFVKLPGKPDIAFVRRQVVIFCHGCFWHGCPKCAKRVPATNSQFWAEKIERNRARDEENEAKLGQLGFRVIVVWECDVKKNLGKLIGDLSDELQAADKQNSGGA